MSVIIIIKLFVSQEIMFQLNRNNIIFVFTYILQADTEFSLSRAHVLVNQRFLFTQSRTLCQKIDLINYQPSPFIYSRARICRRMFTV